MTVLRLFVAVHPPLQVARAMLRRLDDLDLPPNRRTADEQVHLTLLFIGDVDVRQVDHVRESVERAASSIGPFALAPKRLMSLPVRGPSRVVACETSLPTRLAELQRRLVSRLARNPADRQRFTPHLTLCRLNTPTAQVRIDAPIVPHEIGPFDVRCIRLMRSHLAHTGARHFPESEVELVEMPGTQRP